MKVLVQQYEFEIIGKEITYIGEAIVMYEKETKLVIGLDKKISLKGEEKIEDEDIKYCEEEMRCMIEAGHLKRCTGVVKKVEEEVDITEES